MLPYPDHLGIGRAGELCRTPVFRCPVLRAKSGENTVRWHPRQLRAFMKRDPRDLLGEFRALAPQRPPIILQRWSIRRVALAAAMLAVTVIALYIGVQTVIPVGNLGASAPAAAPATR